MNEDILEVFISTAIDAVIGSAFIGIFIWWLQIVTGG